MAVTLSQYGDWVFANDNWKCKVGWAEARTQYTTNPVITPRAGSSPRISQGNISERTIPVEFIYTGTGDLRDAIRILTGKLDPRELTLRKLIGATHDGVSIQRMAMLSLSDGWSIDQSMNTVKCVFVSDTPEWYSVALTTEGPYVLSTYGQSYASVALPNPGFASIEPLIVVGPGAFSHLSTSATVGWKYLRLMTFTNNTGKTWSNRPLRLDLGDTSAWVTAGKALSSGDDLRVTINGVDYPRSLIAWNYGKTYVWFTPPPVAAGDVLNIEIIYGNPSAGTPSTLSGKLHPSFLYEYDTGTVTTGATTTSIPDTTKTWTAGDIYWIGGQVQFITGVNAGLSRPINAHTTNTLTVSAFPSAPAAGDKYLITLSDNGRWWLNTGGNFTTRSVTVRGRWYLNSTTARPRDIDYSVPGSWSPYAMWDNSDRFSQTAYSWISNKPYAKLDAYRSWQGGGRMTSEDGVADGVAFTSVLPITMVAWQYDLKNNINGMCQAVCMARANGAESWETIFSDTSASNIGASQTTIMPVTDKYYNVYLGLGPIDDEGVIRVDRHVDNGSTSSDGAVRNSTLTSTQTLRKTPSSSGAAVTDQSQVAVSVPSGTVIERDGWWSGNWRHVIYSTLSGEEYRGWLPVSALGTEVGGNTLIDGSKTWVTNELVGAVVKITGSANKWLAGRTFIIQSNTATTITFTSQAHATIVSGTAYEIRQAKTVVRLTDGAYGWVDFDTTGLTLSSLGSETPVYQVAAELAMGGLANMGGKQNRVRIGLDGAMIFLASGEEVRIDCSSRKSYITKSSGTSLKRYLTDPAVRVLQDQVLFDQLGFFQTVRAARWFPMAIGTNQLSNGDAESASLSPWTASANATGVTGTITQDTTIKYAGSKSFKFNISASTAAAGDELMKLSSAIFTIAELENVIIPAWVYTTNANLVPYLGIQWYNGVTPMNKTFVTSGFTPPISTWIPLAVQGVNQSSNQYYNLYIPTVGIGGSVPSASGVATGAAVYLAVRSLAANATGSVYFDNIDHGSPPMTVTEIGMNQLNVTVTFPLGYLS